MGASDGAAGQSCSGWLFALAGFSRLGRVGWGFTALSALRLNGNRVAIAIPGNKADAFDRIKPPDRTPIHHRLPSRAGLHVSSLYQTVKAAYWLLSKLTGCRSELAREGGKDNAGSQDERGDGEFFASKLAPTRNRGAGLAGSAGL